MPSKSLSSWKGLKSKGQLSSLSVSPSPSASGKSTTSTKKVWESFKLESFNESLLDSEISKWQSATALNWHYYNKAKKALKEGLPYKKLVEFIKETGGDLNKLKGFE